MDEATSEDEVEEITVTDVVVVRCIDSDARVGGVGRRRPVLGKDDEELGKDDEGLGGEEEISLNDIITSC